MCKNYQIAAGQSNLTSDPIGVGTKLMLAEDLDMKPKTIVCPMAMMYYNNDIDHHNINLSISKNPILRK